MSVIKMLSSSLIFTGSSKKLIIEVIPSPCYFTKWSISQDIVCATDKIQIESKELSTKQILYHYQLVNRKLFLWIVSALHILSSLKCMLQGWLLSKSITYVNCVRRSSKNPYTRTTELETNYTMVLRTSAPTEDKKHVSYLLISFFDYLTL